MAEVQNLTRYKHVTGYSEGVEAVTLVHNHYHVPHVALHGVDPEVGVHRLPPLASPHWTPDGPGRSREGYHINPVVRCGRRCFPLRGKLLPVLGMAMV